MCTVWRYICGKPKNYEFLWKLETFVVPCDSGIINKINIIFDIDSSGNDQVQSETEKRYHRSWIIKLNCNAEWCAIIVYMLTIFNTECSCVTELIMYFC